MRKREFLNSDTFCITLKTSLENPQITCSLLKMIFLQRICLAVMYLDYVNFSYVMYIFTRHGHRHDACDLIEYPWSVLKLSVSLIMNHHWRLHPCADPEGEGGGPGKSQKYRIS